MAERAEEKKDVGRAVLEALLAEGVDMVFGQGGSHVMAVYDALADAESIRTVNVAHENNAAIMADVYGRLTHRPGVCLVTAGPGAVNSLSGVAQAYDAASPMVHISGTVPLASGKEEFHGVDAPDFLCKMFREVTKWSTRAEAAEDVPEVMARAFSIARSGRPGPVHIEFPKAVSPSTSPWLIQAEPVSLKAYREVAAERYAPDMGLLRRASEILLSSKRTVICAGKGVLASDATEELLELGEKLSAPVIFPFDAIGVIPGGHPLAIGYFSIWEERSHISRLVREAEALLCVGMRAGTSKLELVMAHAPAKTVFIGFDDDPGNNCSSALISFVADSKLALRELLQLSGGRKGEPDEAWKDGAIALKVALEEALLKHVEQYRETRPIHGGIAVRELLSQAESDAILTTDVGNCALWLRPYVRASTPESLLQSGMWNSMGFALPAAIAAKLLFPHRQVIGVAGDGGFLTSCSDFATAVREKANIVMVILNDSEHGLVRELQVRHFGRAYATELGAVDFAEFARSFGAVGVRVENPSELKPALRKALDAGEPAIVDVVSGIYRSKRPPVEELLRKISSKHLSQFREKA